MTKKKVVPVEYGWQQGSRYGVDPNVVGETVNRLSESLGGVCPPGALVDEARPVDSELHGEFDWDNDEAAEKWRLVQARQLIRSLVIVSAGPVEERAPAFVHVRRLSETEAVQEGYRPLRLVVRSGTESQFVMDEALTMLDGLARRFAHVPELQPVWAALLAVRGARYMDEAAS